MEEKKSGIKKFFEEFKAFAMRGNVLDMAVGVVIGSAFTAIVTALVEDIINPLIGLFFKADFSDVVIGLGGSSIKIGEFVNSIINFLIVAFVLFVVIKFVNSLHKKPEAPAEPEEPTTKLGCGKVEQEVRWENQGFLLTVLLNLGQLSQLVVDLGVVVYTAELLGTDTHGVHVDHGTGVGVGGVVHT